MTARLAPGSDRKAVSTPASKAREPAVRAVRRPGEARLTDSADTQKGDASGAEPSTIARDRVADSRYYAADEIDAYPRPLDPLGQGMEGAWLAAPASIRLSVYIDEHGKVRRVAVMHAEPPDAGGIASAQLARARFAPAMRQGRAVRSVVVLEFRPGGAAGR